MICIVCGVNKAEVCDSCAAEGNEPYESQIAELQAVLKAVAARHGRWVQLDETSPSGRTLFYCIECGRKSYGPDKTCPKGCKDPDVGPEYFEALRKEQEAFEREMEASGEWIRNNDGGWCRKDSAHLLGDK